MTFDLFLITGQSLAVGRAPAISRTPVAPDRAFCLTGGPVGENRAPTGLPLVPLAERMTETVASGMVAQLLAQEPALQAVVAGQAWGGQPYAALRRGGPSGAFETVTAQARLLAEAMDLRAGALLLLHGETDGALGTQGYDRILATWQADFAQALGEALGQRSGHALDTRWTAPMLYCQTSSISGYCEGGDRAHFQTPLAQLAAHAPEAGRVLIGPKYAYDYIDWAHLDAASTRRHGELFGKVLAHLRRGGFWSPLVPRRIARNGLSVKIDFTVPAPPLVLDTDRVSNPGAYGFHLDDPARRITGVTLSGPDSITLTLDAPPRPGTRIGYALLNGEAGTSGRHAGARGNLRDSDATPSAFDGQPLHNWCVAFSSALPDV